MIKKNQILPPPPIESLKQSTILICLISFTKNILAKQLGSSNPLNNARATLDGLSKLRTFQEVAQERNLVIENLYS